MSRKLVNNQSQKGEDKYEIQSNDGARNLAHSLYHNATKNMKINRSSRSDLDLEAFLNESNLRENVNGDPTCLPNGLDDPHSECIPPLRGLWDKKDGRLHHEYPLYCEGMHKPSCRGIIHLISTLILPYGLYILIKECNDNTYGIISSIFYVISNIWCYGASAIYHVGKWSPKTEILLQKLDHAGISIMSVGTFLPTILLLFPLIDGIIFLLLLIITCGYNIYNIIQLRPSVLGQAFVPAVSVLFIYRMYDTFTSLEFSLYILTCILKSIGVIIFVKQKPDPLPDTFGYHELFHCFVVASGVAIFICNFSIIHRICNPYAHDMSIVEGY